VAAIVGALGTAAFTYLVFPKTPEPWQSWLPVGGFLLLGGVVAWLTRPRS
jgi:hypothetical protein